METIYKVLDFLSGKKTSIATIISAILVFGMGRGWIATDVAELISTIMLALGISVNYLDAKRKGVV